MPSRARIVAPLRPRLIDGDRGELQERLVLLRTEQGPRLVLRGEQQIRCGLFDEAQRRSAALREERGRRAHVQRHERAGLVRQRRRRHAREPQRLIEERVRREVDAVGAGEPLGLEVLGAEPERRATILDERPLPTRLHEHADAARRAPRDPDGPYLDPVAAHSGDEGPADGIPPDRADEARSRAEAAEPAGGRRGAAALAQADEPRNVRPTLQGPGRREDDVDDEVAKHDDRRRVGPLSRTARGGEPRGADTSGGGKGGHGRSLAAGSRATTTRCAIPPTPSAGGSAARSAPR